MGDRPDYVSLLRRLDRQLAIVLSSPVLREHNAIVLRDMHAEVKAALAENEAASC